MGVVLIVMDEQILARLRAEKEAHKPTLDFSAIQNRLDQWATRTKKNDGYQTTDVVLLYAEAERLTTELAEAQAFIQKLNDTDRTAFESSERTAARLWKELEQARKIVACAKRLADQHWDAVPGEWEVGLCSAAYESAMMGLRWLLIDYDKTALASGERS